MPLQARLWDRATKLFRDARWAFQPDEVVRRRLTELADVLHVAGVSQRHSMDSAAWRMIAESLTDGRSRAVRRAVYEGEGEAGELLAALSARTVAGTAMFPFLAGPKVGPMWVRMLVVPGEARIAGIEKIPIAVDVQVRKVTENLGVTATAGQDLEQVREQIQRAWQADVEAHGADGPDGLTGTAAALDPAIWFMGKWGCTFCERAKKRMPIADVCRECGLMKAET